MGRQFLTFLFLFLGSSLAWSQSLVPWETFENVQYRFRYMIEYETWMEKPVFSSEVEEYKNKEVQVKGFVIPYSAAPGKYFVSKYPNSACYFCNKAGKGTVVKLQLKDPENTFEIDDVVTFTGTLKLNDDPTDLHYTLRDAIPIKRHE